ncbi:MAG: hypothetical protein ACUZ8O_09300 [Candidatus Anammoxibacter sp.]
MNKKDWLKSILVYACITFFVITIVFIYMSFRGKPQAGLIEVSSSAALFVIFIYLIKKVLPQALGIISTVLSILIAIIFISSNYYLQLKQNKDYSIREILIGDLLAKKFMGTDNEVPYKLPDKSFTDKVGRSQFAQTTTEKYTIESTFERPEKIDKEYKLTKLTIDDLYRTPLNGFQDHTLAIPMDKVVYKFKLSAPEPVTQDSALAIAEKAEDIIYDGIASQHIMESTDLPLETNFSNLTYTFSNQDTLFAQRLEQNVSPVPREKKVMTPIANLIDNTLQKP